MNWETVKMGDIADSIQPGPFGSQLHSSDYSNEGTPIIMPKDMIDGHISHANLAFVSDEHVNRLSRHQVHKGNLMVARKGDVRKCVFITENEEGWMTGSDCLKVALDESKCFPRYIYYQLRSPYIGKWLETISIGATMPSINTGLLSGIELYLPPLAVQMKIASVLSDYDALIQNNQKQIKLLEEAAQRLYKEWFVDLRFPGYEKTEIIDGVPVGWKKEKLVKIADIKAGGDKPEEYSNNKTRENSIPIYANGTEKEGLFGYTNKPVITDESVTISARGTVGCVFLRRTPYVPIVRLLSVIPYEVSAVYLYYCLSNEQFERNGTSQQQITVPMVKDKLILIADKETVRLFVQKVIGNINKKDVLTEQCKLLKEARDRLLPKLMNGEIEI